MGYLECAGGVGFQGMFARIGISISVSVISLMYDVSSMMYVNDN